MGDRAVRRPGYLLPGAESDDEAEKLDVISPSETHGPAGTQPTSTLRSDIPMREPAAPSPAQVPNPTPAQTTSPRIDELPEIVVPSQETFTFQSQHAYPQDAYLNLANLDLSDSRSHDPPSRTTASSTPSTRRVDRRSGVRTGSRSSLGRGAGQKRKVNLAEIFDLGESRIWERKGHVWRRKAE